MKPDFNLCDCCGKRVDGPSLFVATDRKMDAAGSMDTDGEQFDICQACAVDLIRNMLVNDAGYELGCKIVDIVNRLKRMHKASGGTKA